MKQTKLPDIAIADNEFRGSKNTVYSVKGGMLLACRIAMSNISARGIGKVLLRGTHHSTAASWEIKCRAAMKESARVFYRGLALDLYHHAVADAPGWKFALHQYRSDATNAHVWQSSKLHTTEVNSLFTTEPVLEDTTVDDVINSREERRLLGDLQVVRNSTAEGTLGCIRKQLMSIGAINPMQMMQMQQLVAAGPDSALTLPSSSSPGALCDYSDSADNMQATDSKMRPMLTYQPEDGKEVRVLQAWLAVTDAGGDEKKARGYLQAMTSRMPFCIFFDHDCFLHQYQLMVKGHLAHCDKLFMEDLGADYRFYASLSKLMIVWRDKARDIHDCWHKLYPSEAARMAGKVPPKCIRGRWGAVSNCEAFILERPREHLVNVLDKVFGNGANQTAGHCGSTVGLEDDPYEEDCQAHSIKMGKWARIAMNAIKDDRF